MRDDLRIDAGRILVILLTLSMIASVFLTGITHAALTEGKSGKTTWVYMGAGKDGKAYKSTNTNNKQPKYTVKVGSTKYVGYCIDPDKGWGTGTKMTARTFAKSKAAAAYSKTKQELLGYALLYGYNTGKSAPYGNANDYYAATQTLIWQILEGHAVMNSSGKWTKTSTSDKPYKLIKGHTYGIRCYDHIRKQMSDHVKGASFTKATSSAAAGARYKMKYSCKTGKWSVTLTDSAAVNHLKLTAATSGLKMTRSGNKYTFSASKAGKYTATLMNDRSFGTAQAAMVFDSGKSSIQSVALGATDTKKFYAAFVTEQAGTGRLVKVDADGNRLEGFRFKVVCAANGYSGTWTTGSDGTVAKSLYPGTYTVTEVLTSEQIKDRWIKAGAQKLVISEGKASTLQITNDRDTTGSLRIVKVTSDGGPVGGFRFDIKGVLADWKQLTEQDVLRLADPVLEDGDYEAGAWTVEDPEVLDMINEDMAAGKTETYLLKLRTEAALKQDAEAEKKAAKDERTKAAGKTEEAKETKASEDPKDTGNAEAAGKTEAAKDAKAAEDPKDTGDPKASGKTEEAKETKASEDPKDTVDPEAARKTEGAGSEKAVKDEEGSEGTEDPEDAEEPQDPKPETKTETKPETLKIETRVTVTTRALSDAAGDPVRKTGDGVASTDFCWNGAADAYQDSFVTDDEGMIVITRLEPGTYTMTEAMDENQAARYREPASQTVTITGEETETEPFVFENQAKEARVRVIKKCRDGEISDILFRITGTTAWGETLAGTDDETGEKTDGIYVRTDENGVADFGTLPAGRYMAEEPELDLEEYMEVAPQYFEITGAEKDGQVIELCFENRRKAGLEISKQDGTTGEELPGAQLRLTDKDTGEVLDEWTSGTEPHYIEGLEYGRHVILQEILPPEMVTGEEKGFTNAEGEYVTGFATAEPIEIVVGADKKAVMVDELTQTVISKLDETSCEELPGALLQIMDPETGEVIHQWVSEEEPHMVEGLIEGKTYVLREDQAPLGFAVAESIEFTVGEDSEVVMYDNHLPGAEITSPETGDPGKAKAFAGIVIMCVSALTAWAALSGRRRRT